HRPQRADLGGGRAGAVWHQLSRTHDQRPDRGAAGRVPRGHHPAQHVGLRLHRQGDPQRGRLRRKRFGGWGMPMERAILQAMMARDGADVDDVQFVVLPGGVDLVTMLTRDIDFTWIYYGWQGIEAELRGVELDVMMMDQYFDAVPDYYPPVLVTSVALIASDPELIRAVVEATTRGYVYAAEHPDEAAEILLKYAPENDPELVRASQRRLSPRYIDDA